MLFHSEQKSALITVISVRYDATQCWGAGDSTHLDARGALVTELCDHPSNYGSTSVRREALS